MKVLLINGSPHRDGCTAAALRELEKTLRAGGAATELCWLGTAPVAGCIACNKCRDTGRCVFDDGVNAVLARLDEFDALVLGSPVYFAGASGQLCAFLDRLFYCAQGRMAGKLGAAVVSCRRGGAATAFERLNKYFGLSNMHTVGSQYWNQVHGYSPQEVARDEEGLQTMRTLGQNMIWLLKCREAGAAAGVTPPTYEPRVTTNFIR